MSFFAFGKRVSMSRGRRAELEKKKRERGREQSRVGQSAFKRWSATLCTLRAGAGSPSAEDPSIIAVLPCPTLTTTLCHREKTLLLGQL